MMRIAVFVLLCLCSAALAQLNIRPIVGIVTQPTDGDFVPYGNAYIAASYVKFIESAGARVVPIFHNDTASGLASLLGSLNGVLFPGGGASFSGQYWATVTGIWNFALSSNQAGRYFPVLGICMGFQELSILASGNMSLLSMFNSENLTIPLNLTRAAASSRFFSAMPAALVKVITTQPVTMNNHQYGVSPASFAADPHLPSFYSVLSTNNDRNGLTFLSTMEAYHYPIWALQWHPEKNIFEWTPEEVINHSPDAIAVAQFAADFFVMQARMSQAHFPSVAAESAALIYNYAATYTGLFDVSFEQSYFWTLNGVNASTTNST